MARIFVTGSADGLGRGTARALLDSGHEVVVHVRHRGRLDAVDDLVRRGAHAVVGDLRDLGETKQVAAQAQALGPFDAVVHNAGTMSAPDALPVNVVAPYVLTALVDAGRLVYLSSSMHTGGAARLDGLTDPDRGPRLSYSDSKLLVTALAFAVARCRPDVPSNAVDPGWVPTRMGGPGAPDDLTLGHETQVWLAVGDDPDATTTGGYWHHRRRQRAHPAASDLDVQDRLTAALAARTGVPEPW